MSQGIRFTPNTIRYIDSTTEDMLQGRVAQSVLARHYLVPLQDLKDSVLTALSNLKTKLDYYC